MSKNDVIIKSVIELNRILESVIGFQYLLPESAETDYMNVFIRSSLEKIEIDLKGVIKNIFDDPYLCELFAQDRSEERADGLCK